MELGSIAQRYERLIQGRDLVRRAAGLLSADVPLPQLFAELATLLNGFVDASTVLVTVSDDAGIQPDGPIARVLAGGEAVRTKAAIHLPIPFGGRVVGVLTVGSSTSDAYDEDDRVLLETCALYLGARIHDERQRETSETLARLATTDALTGLANRRRFDEVLALEWRRCARSQSCLSLAILDVDFFKRFNDAYGHVAGDACLRQIAQVLAASVNRPGDVVARYGGEEFAFVLPEIDAEGGIALAETICQAVTQLRLPHEGSTLGYASVSIGLASIVPRVDDDPRRLIEAADTLLYAAKESGRNRVAADAYRSTRPVAAARVVVRYHLPRYVTPAIGREGAMAGVAALLQTSPVTTIAGPGGIGKTRLAVQVALQEAGSQRDGTWFADLAPLTDPDLVASTLASAIGLTLGPSLDPVEALVSLLKPQHLLVVLDNCEQVAEGAARVAAAIASACPDVRVLATSRQPLGLEAESLYRLEALDDAAACELFFASARRGAPDFALAAGDEAIVTDICRQLDGVPLAIELAAARVRAMPLAELRSRLDERFRLLTGGKRPGAPRQQTMLASIGWSYDLLSERERTVFLRLAAFNGGFALRAAANVAADDAIAPWDVDDALAALVDKSMIAFESRSERYRMLESIRQYAQDRLSESGTLERARRAHARYFADVADEAAARYGYTTQDEWLGRYEPDLDNFRAALDWATHADCVLAARLAGNLAEYWDYCGLAPEGLRRSEAVLARLDARPDAEVGPVYLAVAHLRSTIRSYREASAAGERALAIAERLDDAFLLARVRRTLGAIRYILGDGERGSIDLRLALEYFRTHDNPLRRMGAIYAYALTLEPQAGRPLLLEALALAHSSGWTRLAVAIEMNLSERDFWSGDVDGARERTRRAIALSRNRRSPLDLAMALGNLASYSCIAGAHDEASSAAGEAAAIASTHGFTYSFAISTLSLAVVRVASGDADAAAQLLGFVDAAFKDFGFALEQTEARVRNHLIELLAGALDEPSLERQTAAGASLSMEQAHNLGIGKRRHSRDR